MATSRRRLGGNLAPWQMRRLREFVEAHIGTNPSITELARLCELSPSYFATAFKQTIGMSPHQWLLKRRIERAKLMLRQTRRPRNRTRSHPAARLWSPRSWQS